MPPTIAELVDALPHDEGDEHEDQSSEQLLRELVSTLSTRPVPTGRLSRLWSLGTLQAKIAAAYLAYWVRSSYAGADESERRLNETHLKAALGLLGGMTYLRGAIMKVGQTLASYPDILPAQFIEALETLHFQAPPMHFSLLRELVERELGGDPEDVFDEFETTAFAAASLGQVHRARLKNGRPVAVKIQYPNIARSIRSDFRNLSAFLLPMRLSGDWDNLKEQFEEMRRVLELETDYEQEARFMRMARSAFGEDDEIVVPRVYDEYSTRRVLTMDYLDGLHVGDFLATNPTRERCDRHGSQIALATLRLYYREHLTYADPNPGNFIFLPDGRLGLIDFGCCRVLNDEEWAWSRQCDDAIDAGPQERREAVIRGAALTEAQRSDTDRIEHLERISDWLWEPFRARGPFDFGDETYLKRGIELITESMRRRYLRSMPVLNWLLRLFFGFRSLAYRLGARIDMRALYDQERRQAKG